LDKTNDDVSQLQTQLEQLSDLQKEFDEYRRRSEAMLEEQEMRHRDSTFSWFQLRNSEYASGIIIIISIIIIIILLLLLLNSAQLQHKYT